MYKHTFQFHPDEDGFTFWSGSYEGLFLISSQGFPFSLLPLANSLEINEQIKSFFLAMLYKNGLYVFTCEQ